MAKIIKKGDANFRDTSKIRRLSSGSKQDGCIAVIDSTSGCRLRLGKSLLADLNSPSYIWVGESEGEVFIGIADKEEHDTYEVKNGGYIYNKELAEDIKGISKAEFKPKTTTKVGKYCIQTEDDGSLVAVICFK